MFDLAIDIVKSALLVGIGIGIDAIIATVLLASALKDKDRATFWIIGITFTHVSLPIISFYSIWKSLEWFPASAPIVGVIAFTAIVFLFWQWLNEVVDADTSEADTRKDAKTSIISIWLVIAISLDALYSGPAIFGHTQDWPSWATALMFLVVGNLLALLLAASLYIVNSKWVNVNKLLTAQCRFWAIWIQMSAIGYFAFLALFRLTFGWELASVILLLLSAIFAGSITLYCRWIALQRSPGKSRYAC